MLQVQAYERHLLRSIEPSIPAHYYYDAKHYERELDVFWYNMWIQVGRLEEIPNPKDYKVFPIGNQNIVVLRDLKNNLHAFHNTCRLRGSILCTEEQGSIKGESIVCPYHAWVYSLDGKLVATPRQISSPDFDMAGYSLYNVAVETWGGYIFVNLASDRALPFEVALGDVPTRLANYHMEDLRIGKRIVMDVKANWKLLFENFAECFHCPTVHHELCAIVPAFGEAGAYGVREDADGNLVPELRAKFKKGAKTLTMDGTAKIPPFRGLSKDQRDILYTTGVVRPNFFMNVHPDYINTHTMFATGPESVRMVYDWLFEPDSMARPDFDLDFYVELWDVTNKQDARNCEWQQAGLRCRNFEHGNFVPQEFGPHTFNQWVLQCLGEMAEEVKEATVVMGV